MSLDKLTQHKKTWETKPLLRLLYRDWYQLIKNNMTAGRTLEIGGGSGNFKEFMPEVISGDIVRTDWTDLAMSAEAIPFGSSSLENIVLFDVLHHLENPVLFLREAGRVLVNGGRLIMMEPYVSPFSYIVYRWLHPEPLDMNADPFAVVAKNPDRRPFDANNGIPTLFFKKHLRRFRQEFPTLKVKLIERLSFLTYPLSGGFEKPALIPAQSYPFFCWLEKKMKRFSALLAFRMLVVLEKNQETQRSSTKESNQVRC